MPESNSKAIALAKALDARVVDDSSRVEVSVQCETLGFPTTIEAIRTHFPFGTNYYVNIDVLKENVNDPNATTLLITPKVAKGVWNMVSKLLLVDPRDKPIGDPQFDRAFNLETNDYNMALRFIRYPGMMEKITEAHQFSGFSELHVRAKAGLWLVQPTSFEALNLDVAKETVRLLGEMGQVLFDILK